MDLAVSPVVAPVVDSIYDIIARARISDDIEIEYNKLYTPNPIIGKASCWDPLGTKLSANEKVCPVIISSDKYFTIRADGKNFSTVVPALKSLGIFESGYSTSFENIMKTLAEKFTKKFQRVLYVFTQSDEITILIDKVHQVEGHDLQPHEYSGRRDKLISLAASFATNVFNQEIFKLCCDKFTSNTELLNVISKLPTIIFDARIGTYDNFLSAFELILWRSYDCSVNGISQAIYFNKFEGFSQKELNLMNTTEKLNILKQHNMLPLSDHQAYGTLLKQTHIDANVTNQKTGVTSVVKKLHYNLVPGPVVRNLKLNRLKLNGFESIVTF
jgi:tRNA(His) 5'-end guanylyltransferase